MRLALPAAATLALTALAAVAMWRGDSAPVAPDPTAAEEYGAAISPKETFGSPVAAPVEVGQKAS